MTAIGADLPNAAEDARTRANTEPECVIVCVKGNDNERVSKGASTGVRNETDVSLTVHGISSVDDSESLRLHGAAKETVKGSSSERVTIVEKSAVFPV